MSLAQHRDAAGTQQATSAPSKAAVIRHMVCVSCNNGYAGYTTKGSRHEQLSKICCVEGRPTKVTCTVCGSGKGKCERFPNKFSSLVSLVHQESRSYTHLFPNGAAFDSASDTDKTRAMVHRARIEYFANALRLSYDNEDNRQSKDIASLDVNVRALMDCFHGLISAVQTANKQYAIVHRIDLEDSLIDEDGFALFFQGVSASFRAGLGWPNIEYAEHIIECQASGTPMQSVDDIDNQEREFVVRSSEEGEDDIKVPTWMSDFPLVWTPCTGVQ